MRCVCVQPGQKCGYKGAEKITSSEGGVGVGGDKGKRKKQI